MKPDCPMKKSSGGVSGAKTSWSSSKSSEFKRSDKKQKDGKAFLTALGARITKDGEWYLDSGATAHMTPRKDWMVDFQEMGTPKLDIVIANDEKLYCDGSGNVPVRLNCNNSVITITGRTVKENGRGTVVVRATQDHFEVVF